MDQSHIRKFKKANFAQVPISSFHPPHFPYKNPILMANLPNIKVPEKCLLQSK